ncbi:MAG TPA: sulfur transferase domain-containing protein [Holophagaceae bacterium]|nr:sulfur transferase domain-containing protein [Holophagaceae bacterium]
MKPTILLSLALTLAAPQVLPAAPGTHGQDPGLPTQLPATPAPVPSTRMVEVRPGLHVGGLTTYQILMNLRQKGIHTVVHLRPDAEFMSGPATERVAVELQSLRYVHAPVTPDLEDSDLDSFRIAMSTVDFSQGVYMHCFNGNRASGALLTWLVLDEKMPLEEALVLARKGGLQRLKTENAARFYISRNGGPAYVEQDAPKAGMP